MRNEISSRSALFSFSKVEFVEIFFPRSSREFLAKFIGSTAFSRDAVEEKKASGGNRATGSIWRAGHKSERVPQRRHENQPACHRYHYEESVSRQCVSGTHVPFRQRPSFFSFRHREIAGLSKRRTGTSAHSLARSTSRGAFRRELSALLDCRSLWRRKLV